MTGPRHEPAGLPVAGEVVYLDRRASVQFTTPIRVRIIRLHGWSTYDGWVWLDGYELDERGNAVRRRSVFVQPAGLRRIHIVVVDRGRRGWP